MQLPEHFVFTQQNLQDYVVCPYRFYLREVLKLEWPSIESEPVREQEELMQMGTRFHLLCQQYFSGIPSDILSIQINQPELADWWKNFLSLNLIPAPDSFYVEKLISIPLANFRLAAKFDLLIKTSSEKTTIYDWKTSRHQPKRHTILKRMQSKVYPLVASKLNQIQNKPAENIEMIYWYPTFPASPISFFYSQSQRDADQTELELLVAEILEKDEADVMKTNDEKLCRFCRYRSLCDRGVAAGIKDQEDTNPDMEDAFDLDFGAI